MELMYILYDKLSVHGISRFLPADHDVRGLGGGSGDDFTNRYIWLLGKLFIGGFPSSWTIDLDTNFNGSVTSTR